MDGYLVVLRPFKLLFSHNTEDNERVIIIPFTFEKVDLQFI